MVAEFWCGDRKSECPAEPNSRPTSDSSSSSSGAGVPWEGRWPKKLS